MKTQAERRAAIRPQLMASIDRLKRFIELEAPATVIGAEGWLLFKAVLASYGKPAASAMVSDLIEGAVSGRGFCAQGDECVGDGLHRPFPICEPCLNDKPAEFEAKIQEALG